VLPQQIEMLCLKVFILLLSQENGNVVFKVFYIAVIPAVALALLELTCPLDILDHLESARNRKQRKQKYQQICQNLIDWGFPVSMIPLK